MTKKSRGKSKSKGVESYTHRGEKRLRNPEVGLVSVESDTPGVYVVPS